MYYKAKSPIYFSEADWINFDEEDSKRVPVDYSFTPEMVVKEVPLWLPDNDFVFGLAGPKNGTLIPCEDQSEAYKKAKAFFADKKKNATINRHGETRFMDPPLIDPDEGNKAKAKKPASEKTESEKNSDK